MAKSFKWLPICVAFAACHAPNTAYHVGVPTDGSTGADALEHADRVTGPDLSLEVAGHEVAVMDALADASSIDVASEPSAPPPDAGADLAPDLFPDLAEDLAPEGPGTTLPTPVAYWRLDPTSDSSVPDDTRRNAGTLVNGAIYNPGAAPLTFGNPGAVALDGDDDYVSLGVRNLPGLNQPKSISVWFWTSEDARSMLRKDVLSFENLNAATSIHLGLEYGAVAFWTWATNRAYVVAAQRATLGQWHHIGYTFDGQTHALYADGVQVGTAIVSLNGVAVTELFLGTYHPTDEPGERFSGRIDDVRIYDRALTPAQIAALAGGRW